MKQGRASSSGSAGGKVQPVPKAVNVGAAADIGVMKGNHSDHGDLPFSTRPLYEGRGFEAPKGGRTVHQSGSQGKHK